MGMGLAAILAMTLADMSVNSNKQLNNLKASLEREAVRQSLQSLILNPTTCTNAVQKVVFGPQQSSVPGYGEPNVPVRFALSPGVVLTEGQAITNYRLRVDWLRAFSPTLVPSANLPAPQRMYSASLRMKLSPTDTSSSSFDLRAVDIGRVFFTTSDVLGTGSITGCFGYSSEVAPCPSVDQIQIMKNGFWTCMTIGEFLQATCGPNRVLGTGSSAASPLACSIPYHRVTNANCEGFGSLSASATCFTRSCTNDVTKWINLGGTLPPASVVVRESSYLGCNGGCAAAQSSPASCANTPTL